MQQFTVPQFIDVESKIIGPVTSRQFLIFLGAAIVIGLSYKLFDFPLFIAVTIIVILLAGTFAFLKINGRPFHFFVLNFIQTMRRNRLRVWRHDANAELVTDIKAEQKKVEQIPVKERYHSSRLAELSLIVDTQGHYRGKDKQEQQNYGGQE